MQRRRDMSVTDQYFSEVFDNSLEVLAIVQSLAARAKVVSLNALCEQHPAIVRNYCDTARLALHALEKLRHAEQRRGKRAGAFLNPQSPSPPTTYD